MSFSKPALTIISSLRQKQNFQEGEKLQNQESPKQMFKSGFPLPMPDGNPEVHVSYLQQGISAYLDSLQAVFKYGSWISEVVFMMLRGTNCEETAKKVKRRFSAVFDHTTNIHTKTKSQFAQILMELTVPNLNNNNHTQVNKWKLQNAKVLEKCIMLLENVQKNIFEVFSSELKAMEETDNKVDERNSFKFDEETVEWAGLCDVKKNCSSWTTCRQKTECLRKNSGITESEMQNLLKSSVSESYVKKLNSKISSSLKSYETSIRSMSLPYCVVGGGFYIAPDRAKDALKNCCSTMEIEQGIQRQPVSQFLHCELPLIHFKVNQQQLLSDSTHPEENAQLKKKTVSQIVQNINPKLSLNDTDVLTCEVLGEICPARWRTHVKASLQLLFGNSGLVVLDTIDNDQKELPRIMRKSSYIIVSIPSTWCIKEDPGTMFMLHRAVDPDKMIIKIQARYVAVYKTTTQHHEKFEPGIFVEVGLQNALGRKKDFTSPSFWLNGLSTDKVDEIIKLPIAMPSSEPTEFREEEAVQDAIKLLSGSVKICDAIPAIEKVEKQDKDKPAKSIDKEGHITSQDENKPTVSQHSTESNSPSVHKPKEVPTPGSAEKPKESKSSPKSNTLPGSAVSGQLSKKVHLPKHASGKSASFSAFDKNLRVRYQRPVFLIRNPRHPNPRLAENAIFQNISAGHLQANSLYVSPGVTGFQQLQYPAPLSADNATIRTNALYLPSQIHSLQPQQLARPSSPFSYMAGPSLHSNGNFQPTIKPTPVQNFAKTQQQLLQHQMMMANKNPEMLPEKSYSLPGKHPFFSIHPQSPSLVTSDFDQSTSKQVEYSNLKDFKEANQEFHERSNSLPSPYFYEQQHKLLQTNLERDQFFFENVEKTNESLGPIGSPISARRLSCESKGSNTWPNTRKASISNSQSEFVPEEPEYMQYVEGIKSAMAREPDNSVKNPPQSEVIAGQESYFKVFATPDLVQHVIPKKQMTEENGSSPASRQ